MDCPYCGQPAAWVENKVIYGVNIGRSYMIWYCEACQAWVGCHGNTQIPLGTMANRELRSWRQRAHRVIDPLWKGGQMTRREVYAKLQELFGKPIHIGEADIQTCQEVIEKVAEYVQAHHL